ncbi:MAG: glycosyl hydrolase 53 family protein [Anaerolineales bacterium]
MAKRLQQHEMNLIVDFHLACYGPIARTIKVLRSLLPCARKVCRRWFGIHSTGRAGAHAGSCHERGLGVMLWDATWTDVPGNGWDPFDPTSPNNWANQALFDYENRALPAMKLFNQP